MRTCKANASGDTDANRQENNCDPPAEEVTRGLRLHYGKADRDEQGRSDRPDEKGRGRQQHRDGQK